MVFWAFGGVSCDLFVGLLGPLGASWGRLGELLGPSSEILDGILGDKAPKMSPRRPKEPPEASKGPPKGPQKTPQTPPRGLPEALKSFQEAFQRTPKIEKDNNILII